MTTMPKRVKKLYKKLFTEFSGHGRSLVDTTHSMREDEKVIIDPNDSEYWYRVGIMDPEGDTDEEINEYFEGMRVRIFSDYDCTGRAFTRYISWHRNPCGLVSYVHAMTIDV